jgi:hypothetical protein
MLPYESTKQEDAVEKYFCEPLSKKETEEMSKDLTDFFMTFATSTEENVDVEKARKTVWQFQALEKRMSLLLNFTADNRVKLFILVLTDGSIGKIIMYLYYMQHLCKKNNVKHITWEIFGMQFFPYGFFSDEDLHSVWEGQKVSRTSADGKIQAGTDNLLDYQTAAKSILL